MCLNFAICFLLVLCSLYAVWRVTEYWKSRKSSVKLANTLSGSSRNLPSETALSSLRRPSIPVCSVSRSVVDSPLALICVNDESLHNTVIITEATVSIVTKVFFKFRLKTFQFIWAIISYCYYYNKHVLFALCRQEPGSTKKHKKYVQNTLNGLKVNKLFLICQKVIMHSFFSSCVSRHRSVPS